MAVVYEFGKAKSRWQPVLRTSPKAPATVTSLDEYKSRREDEQYDMHYRSFISLMKYFVQIQDRNDYIVSVFPEQGGGFVILVDGKVLDYGDEGIKLDMAAFDHDEHDIEDALISNLVGLAPFEINIHWREGMNEVVVETIQEIFGERVLLVNA